MTRRTWLQALAGAPLVGRWFGEPEPVLTLGLNEVKAYFCSSDGVWEVTRDVVARAWIEGDFEPPTVVESERIPWNQIEVLDKRQWGDLLENPPSKEEKADGNR